MDYNRDDLYSLIGIVEGLRSIVRGDTSVVLQLDPAALLRHVEITSVEITPGSEDDINWEEIE